MANVIKIKRGSGTPTTSNLAEYQLGYDYTNNKLYIHDPTNSSGQEIVEVSGSGASTSGSNNQLLTDDGSGGINSESKLTFDNSFLELTDSQLRLDNSTFGTYNWEFQQDDGGDLLFKVPSTGGAEIRVSADGGSNSWKTAQVLIAGEINLHADGTSYFKQGATPLVLGGTSAYTTGGTPRLSIQGAGLNIGSGTNDMSYMRRIATGEYQWQTWNGANDGELHLQPYGGKVGIGTATPSQKLEVAGAIKSTGTGGFTIGNVAGVDRIQNSSNSFSFLTDGNAYAGMTFGTVTAGTWQGTAIANAYVADLPASKITSGELATARVNWDSTDKTVRWNNGRGYHGNPRSVAMGYSGSNYGQLGYNIEFTTTSGQHTYSFNDIATRVDLYDGIVVYTSVSGGTAGSTISWTELLECRNNTFTFKGSQIPTMANGSNNRVMTSNDAYSINGEANLTFDGNHLDITSGHLVLPYGEINDSGTDLNIVGTNAITLQSESGTALTIPNASTNVILEGELFLKDNKDLVIGNGSDLEIKHDGSHNYIKLNNGNLYFRDQSNNNIFQIYREGGGIQLSEGDLKIPATSKIYFDGGGNSYIFEESSDNVVHYVGGQNKMRFNSTGVIFNDGSIDLDFRVESNGDSNMLFVDGGNNRVGIGTGSPDSELHVVNNTANLKIESTGSGNASYLHIKGTTNQYDIFNNAGNLQIDENGVATRFLIEDGTGRIAVGHDDPDALLHINPGNALCNIKLERQGVVAWRFGIATNNADLKFDAGDDALGGPEVLFTTSGAGHFDNDVVAFSSSTGSDKRLKKNIKPIPYGLKEVLQMNPVEYDWKEKRNKSHDIGVIAQEIEKIIPEVVKEHEDLKTHKEFKTVDYGKMVSVLIKAVQEQQEQIEELKKCLK